jgi:glutathione synthase/RimK-type ligase-like ATP-grasp enzyme
MKVAIHYDDDDRFLSKKWIDYCQQNNIDFRIVNPYDSDIIYQLRDCDAFMWHFSQTDYRDLLFAKQLLYSLQMSGKKVFPDFNSVWHFDDKVGQKYLLESINAPLVPSYVFYTKKEAIDFVNQTTFPKIFKLKGGGGGINVKLVKTRKQSIALINKAFGYGFKPFNAWENLREKAQKFKSGQENIYGIIKGIGRLLVPTTFSRMVPRDKGYVYFQDFIPGNDSDIRVIVIGNKAFAIKRKTRKNDFRASGSGILVYDKEEINIKFIKLAFEINDKIKSQSIAYDFILNEKNDPLLLEISYGFKLLAYYSCPGFWDSELNWYEGPFSPSFWQIENLIKPVKEKD